MKRKVLKIEYSEVMRPNGTFRKIALLQCGHKVGARSMNQKIAECVLCDRIKNKWKINNE